MKLKLELKSKYFILVLFFLLPCWYGINVLGHELENIFFWKEISKNSQTLTAQLNQQIVRPLKKHLSEDLEISAKAGISVYVNDDIRKTLFEKNSDQRLPIASLTKLMTAYTAIESYELDRIVEVSEQAVNQEGLVGWLNAGEEFTVDDLLHLVLMESSNDAAYALAEIFSESVSSKKSVGNFVSLMNFNAGEVFGLENTGFVNPTGLDPDNINNSRNYSTCKDLAALTENLLGEKLIWDILSLSEFNLYGENKKFHHQLKTTNEFLNIENEQPKWTSKIIGGKTGWTPEAQGCLVLVLRAPKQSGYLINVILGSRDRFGEMEKLINWVYEVYKW